MQELMLRFPHLPEQIFKKLDNECLFKCREVAQSWQNILDGRNYPWLRIVNIPTILNKRTTYLHVAAQTGQIQEFTTAFSEQKDINIKNNCDETPFHLACANGRFQIVQLLLQSTDLEIEVNAKDSYGDTAFHLACQEGQLDVINILLENTLFPIG